MFFGNIFEKSVAIFSGLQMKNDAFARQLEECQQQSERCVRRSCSRRRRRRQQPTGHRLWGRPPN